MKKILITATLATAVFTTALFAQGHINVPQIVKDAFSKKFPQATHVTWEKEKGNYEANWGGKEGEDNSVLYTPSGKFVEAGEAIAVNQLPALAINYVKSHFKGASITEAMHVTSAN